MLRIHNSALERSFSYFPLLRETISPARSLSRLVFFISPLFVLHILVPHIFIHHLSTLSVSARSPSTPLAPTASPLMVSASAVSISHFPCFPLVSALSLRLCLCLSLFLYLSNSDSLSTGFWAPRFRISALSRWSGSFFLL